MGVASVNSSFREGEGEGLGEDGGHRVGGGVQEAGRGAK